MASQESYISFQISSGGFNGRELYYYKITPTYTEVKIKLTPYSSREPIEKCFTGPYTSDAFRYLEDKIKKCFEVNPDDIFSGKMPFDPSVASTIDIQLFNTQKFILGKWLPWMSHVIHQLKGLDCKVHMDYQYILEHVEAIKRQALLQIPSFHFTLEDEKQRASAVRVNGFLVWSMDEQTPPNDLLLLKSDDYYIEVFRRLEGEPLKITAKETFSKVLLKNNELSLEK
ncbi:hypothetical protein [Sediminitomix flava]|uniref:Uncharacterized protein n=1 Tax=Sediminitomix flava TaxID=379075 RepID=A0A315YW72_SEDFL|nr:hypothetical protein [Sediminitomix flava]PWJ34155.1 hypothetical protein BC781_11165 [Sediminitomix flava]